MTTAMCPSRQFVVGLKTWAAFTPEHNTTTTVHGVQPICRSLN